MNEVYQYGADGFYAGPVAMPNNTTQKAPEIIEGYVPRWNGETWEQVENHQGKSGYLNGQPHTISEYGPLPEGWSETPPESTAEEKAKIIRSERDAMLAATDHLIMPDYPLADETREALAVYRQALRDLPGQAGFPWVHGDEVPWPKNPL